ncbi:Type cbb3 cytochrome oxidase biogenesis protein CcoG, involved in Cu oxidation [hydrothermal vent metagenome]|uniref:Type cbb3 cytochrome oxidase biogenesis protein CcoG, involved in Cu oxidation n=1 Tax=hydrothermal vent metagenome TaxID=652676 RepID=A0A3B1B1F4_9ZZZZ
MSNNEQSGDSAIYEELGAWHVNTGEETIHAKRMSGRFRTIKQFSSLVWLPYFLVPYLRYGDRQAILFDIPERQFHFYGITILPQDVWILSLILLFFAILLAAVTSTIGRAFCGYFCFQTIWTEVFTWVEEKLEGKPAQRHKLDKSAWTLKKIKLRSMKYFFWLLISGFTGISFVIWFTDAQQLWLDFFSFQLTTTAMVVIGMFTVGTFILAGFMREQTCFWLCPYARIQGVMYDSETVLPTYDVKRGEPRGRLKKEGVPDDQGDCIMCNQCVAVCPTGVDIRQGQQEGCITCGLCLDACDSVMDKISRPRGLIRYASLDVMLGKPETALIKRPRVLVYFAIMLIAAGGILYGLINLGSLELKVLHERQPLFVLLRNNMIQNKYVLKLLNKTDKEAEVIVTVEGPDAMQVKGLDKPLKIREGGVTPHTVFLKIPKNTLNKPRILITFKAEMIGKDAKVEYESMFFSPGL